MTYTNGSLTPGQIEQYEADGYLVLPDLLTEEDLEAPRLAMEEKVSQIADELFRNGLIKDRLEGRPFKYRLAELFSGLTDKEFLQYGRSWRDRLPGYFHLMSSPKILDVVESLIGPEIFSSPVYNVRPKVPGVAAGAVPWHQDKSYWPGAKANPVLTVWIPLVDATPENGCLYIKPRTHRKELLSWHQESYSGTGYTEVDRHHLGKELEVALPVKAGSAIIFNDRCLHMSTPNQSNEVRWSVDLRYQPTDQDPMLNHGIGFLARSRLYPERTASLEDWLNGMAEHQPNS